MNYKRIFSSLIAFIMVISLTACGSDKAKNSEVSNQTTEKAEQISDLIPYETDKDAANIKETINNPSSDSSKATTKITELSSASVPSAWSKAEIVDFYRNAAVKSNINVKSEQVITLKDVSINNGQYEGMIDFVMPIMSKLLANNSTEKDGITGGYANLTESDLQDAKAYSVGENTAIEMVMKNQTDGAHGDMLGGTVGHAISAVGDIGVVTKQLNDLGLPIKISDEDTYIYYTNPTVKVIIDENGNIICGTWRYTVDIRLNNYKVGNSTVDTTSVVMDNVITVNGGFNM